MNTTRFQGTTAADMNYGAANGRYTKEDLEEWAATQNRFVFSIEWRVETRTRPAPGARYDSEGNYCVLQYPVLVSRAIA